MDYDVIIIGGGAAAYSAAIYAGRYNLKTLLVQKTFGGETMLAGQIHNWPGSGAGGIDGFELMKKMADQAKEAGAEVVNGEAEIVSCVKHCMQVNVGEKQYQGKTLVLAVGSEHRTLGLEREDELKGKGLHYCATCDGPLYKGKKVAVVGGGDSAVKSANQLIDMGVSQVYMIVREPDLLRAEPANLDRLQGREGVVYAYENEIVSFEGDPMLQGVVLRVPVDGNKSLVVDGVFVHIGAVPRSGLAEQLNLKLDERGQIDVNPRTMETNVEGVYACGDVTNAAGGFKQIVTASAEGSIAATSAYKDIQSHDGTLFCSLHAVPIT